MSCAGGDTYRESGPFGNWHAERVRSTGFRGFKQKVTNDDDWDQTATTNVKLAYHGSSGAIWGCTGASGACKWESDSAWSYCEDGGYICGFKIKTQSDQGCGWDDSGANAMQFVCCNFKTSVDCEGYWDTSTAICQPSCDSSCRDTDTYVFTTDYY